MILPLEKSIIDIALLLNIVLIDLSILFREVIGNCVVVVVVIVVVR